MSLVINSASAVPDGAIAPTRPGAAIQAVKKERKSCDIGNSRQEVIAPRLDFQGMRRSAGTALRQHCAMTRSHYSMSGAGGSVRRKQAPPLAPSSTET